MNKQFTLPYIKGISCVLPKEKLALKSLENLYGQKTTEKIMHATGIHEVRIAPKHRTSADYCIEAARNLFLALSIETASVDGVVFVSQTPDYILPATSAIIQDKLGLSKNIVAFDINHGCSGYVYGLFQAYMLVQTGYCKRVLVCAGDTISRYIHPEDKALRMVMGDAGSATMIESGKTSKSVFSFFTDGSGAKQLMISAGSNRQPTIAGVTDIGECDEDGNIRSKENLYMNGLEIMSFALTEVEVVIETVLKDISWLKSEVDLFAFHQANELIVGYLSKTMKLTPKKVPVNVKDTGNTGSASIPLMLCNLYSERKEKMDQTILCGFGAGLSCAAAALDLSETVFCTTKSM